jgi:hypothetical protein
MPKTIITYRIFIASPGDVSEERGIIRSVAEELNTNNTIKNIKLEVIGWENNTYPGFADDAQDVINQQINDDYDIFIGIFWSRFGTPTSRDSSGTKEEFERAYKKYLEDKASIHILMYFKDTAIPISQIDPIQIENINKFQLDIRSRGALTKTFNSTNEFESLIRNNLTQLLNDITDNLESTIKEATASSALIVLEKTAFENEDEEERGLFEYIDIAVESINEMLPELNNLTNLITNLGAKMVKRTNQLNKLKGKPKETINRETRKILDDSSNDLTEYNEGCQKIIPVMSQLFNDSMKNFNKAFLIHRDYMNNQEEKNLMLESLLGMRSGIDSAYVGMVELNDMVKILPPLTTKLLKSRNKTNVIMGQISEEFLSYMNIIDDVVGNSF